MAQVSSNSFLNFTEFNLYEALTSLETGFQNFQFFDNVNAAVDSTDFPSVVGTYVANDVGLFWDGPGGPGTATRSFAVGGSDVILDANNNATSGQVTGMILEESSTFFYLIGCNVSAVAFQAAAVSVGVSDDLALLRLMLASNDQITGSAFDDYMFGANGNDTLIGNAGRDSLFGDAGSDTMTGGSGNDTVNGGADNDYVSGGSGNDSVVGGSGSDRIAGGAGQDLLFAGMDTVRDVFIFASVTDSSASTTRDVVYQFSAGTDDIDLRTIDASVALAGNQVFGYGGTTATANAVWHQTSGTSVIVFADTTGDAVADFSIRLASVAALSAGDFLL